MNWIERLRNLISQKPEGESRTEHSTSSNSEAFARLCIEKNVITPERYSLLKDEIAYLLETCLQVTDPNERTNIRILLTRIDELSQSIEVQSDGSVPLSEKNRNIWRELIGILKPFAFPKYLLPKFYALIASTEIAYRIESTNLPLANAMKAELGETITTEYDGRNVVLLMGLLRAYCRYADYKELEQFFGEEDQTTMELGNRRHVENRLRILLATEQFQTILHERALRMQLGNIDITEGEVPPYVEQQDNIGGIPHYIRILTPGEYPTIPKVQEATSLDRGIPRGNVRNQDMLRALLGSEYDKPIQHRDTTKRRGKERRLIFFSLPSLDLGTTGLSATAFPDVAATTRRLYEEYNPDAITLYLARRLQERLEEEFELIDRGFPPEQQAELNASKKKNRAKVVLKTFACTPATSSERSLLSAVVQVVTQKDSKPTLDWALPKGLESQICASVLALCLHLDEGNHSVRLRGEEEIRDIVVDIFWKRLHGEDKSAFSLAILNQSTASLWQDTNAKITDKLRSIHQKLLQSETLQPEESEFLFQAVRLSLVLRWETIVDTFDFLTQKKLQERRE